MLDKGMHEDLDITNFSQKPVRFNLEISVRSDFADVFDVKAGRSIRRGRVTGEWQEADQALRNQYETPLLFARFPLRLRGATHERCLPTDGSALRSACRPAAPGMAACFTSSLTERTIISRRRTACGTRMTWHRRGEHRAWRDTVLKIDTSNEEFLRFYQQAIDDMAALRLPVAGSDRTEFLPAAGLPWFMAPFGRDSLIVSLQNILIYPEFARGTLDILGRWQCRDRDDFRDAEPGKIMHELRYGELAHFQPDPAYAVLRHSGCNASLSDYAACRVARQR